LPKRTKPQRDMLDCPIFARWHDRIHRYSDDALPRWVEPQSGDEIAIR
jgi:hypothetical protein